MLAINIIRQHNKRSMLLLLLLLTFSSSKSGLWSRVVLAAWPLRHTTARESPAAQQRNMTCQMADSLLHAPGRNHGTCMHVNA